MVNINPLARSKSSKYEDQRIGVFVDVQNLYYSAYNIYHSRVNFGALLDSVINKRKLIRAVAYVIQADQPEEQSFFDALSKQGYEVKAKPLQTFIGGAKKGDWDVGVTLDIVSVLEKLDVVVLASGDGDFDDVIHYIKSNGARAEVVAFGKSTASRIREIADDFLDLDVDYKKYTLPMPKRIAGKDEKGVKIFSS